MLINELVFAVHDLQVVKQKQLWVVEERIGELDLIDVESFSSWSFQATPEHIRLIIDDLITGHELVIYIDLDQRVAQSETDLGRWQKVDAYVLVGQCPLSCPLWAVEEDLLEADEAVLVDADQVVVVDAGLVRLLQRREVDFLVGAFGLGDARELKGDFEHWRAISQCVCLAD